MVSSVGRIVPPAVRISLWSRVKSKRGVQFRKWANKVLKQYLLRGYVVNQRLEQLERRVAATEEKIDFFVHKSLPPVEGVFYDGQIFDAMHKSIEKFSTKKSKIFGNRSLILYLCGEKSI